MGVNGIAEPTSTKSGKNEAGAGNKAILALCAPGISLIGMLAFGTAGFETTGLRYGWRVARRKTIGKRAVELHLPVPLRFSRSRFSYFLVLVITFAVAVMVLLFRGAGPMGTSAVVTCSIAVTGWRVWLLVLDICHSARMRAGGKTTSTKVPSCSLLLIVRDA